MTDTKQICDAIKMPVQYNAGHLRDRTGALLLCCQLNDDDVDAKNGNQIADALNRTADLKALVAENEALREQFIKRTSLLECLFCGQQSFEISPIDSRDGICWNEQKIYTIKPGKALAIADGGNDE